LPPSLLSVTHLIVTIELTALETGEEYLGDLPAALSALRERIALAQVSQITRGRRAIIVLEGPEGGAKVLALRQLAAAFDPRFAMTYTVLPDRRRSNDGHWLARFWRDLPAEGRTALYFHSWYRRVLEDRVLGTVSDSDVERAFDEINEFEAQQRDNGTLIIKLYFHVVERVRHERIAERENHSAGRMLSAITELRTPEARQQYDVAVEAMLANTDTRWAPWTALDANAQSGANIAALTAIAESMERAFPAVIDDTDDAIVPMRRRNGIHPA
jgi:polyphosphate kinase 2 (PPK2 family)